MTVGLVKALDPPYGFPPFNKALALNALPGPNTVSHWEDFVDINLAMALLAANHLRQFGLSANSAHLEKQFGPERIALSIVAFHARFAEP